MQMLESMMRSRREYMFNHPEMFVKLTEGPSGVDKTVTPENSIQRVAVTDFSKVPEQPKFVQSDNPYAIPLKPDNVSGDEWNKKFEDDFQRIKPKAMEIVNHYKSMGVKDVFDRNELYKVNPETASFLPKDYVERWEIDNMDAILQKKVRNEGYVLTSDERECFREAAALEWSMNHVVLPMGSVLDKKG